RSRLSCGKIRKRCKQRKPVASSQQPAASSQQLEAGRWKPEALRGTRNPALPMDLNSDLGEGFPHDAALIAIVTSANVACGFHAGDAETMRAAVREAARLGVAIGAHPGYQDREFFGRRALDVPPAQIEAEVISQIDALQAICASEGTTVRYVKPHGALYNRCSVEADAARAVASAVRSASPE